MKSKVFIITGFLGSGKTTLLKRILKSAKDLSRTIVLVNEFGKVGIDGSLIKNTAAANIVELNSGCICCSLKVDLIQTLQILWEKYAPERVIVEATGVADPLSIIETLDDRMLAPHFQYEKTIMVVAGDFWEARHVFGTVFKSQLNQSDLILLNKIDTLEKSAIPVILKEIQDELEAKGIRIHVDEREGLSPGYKFNDWELKGVPLRIEIGPKDIEKQSIVVAKRYNLEKISLGFTEIEKISAILDEIQTEMLKKAKEQAENNTLNISEYSEFKSKIEAGGFFNSPWCGKLECEEQIKEETGAEIRVIPFGSENTNQKCIYCQEQSVSIPIFARGY